MMKTLIPLALLNADNPLAGAYGGGTTTTEETPTPDSEGEDVKDTPIKQTTLGGETIEPGAERTITRDGVELPVVFAAKGRASTDHAWRPLLKDEDNEEDPYTLSPDDILKWLGEDDFYRIINQALVGKMSTDFAQKYEKDSDKFFAGYESGESLFKKATSAKSAAKKAIQEKLKDLGTSDLEKLAALIGGEGGDLNALFASAQAAAGEGE